MAQLLIAFRGHILIAFLLAVLLALGAGQSAAQQAGPMGAPQDWSFRHVLWADAGSPSQALSARQDPRAFYTALRRARALGKGNASRADSGPASTAADHRQHGRPRAAFTIDWAVSLGGGNVPQNMFPAKFQFDVNAAPNCTTDYVVFGLNAAGVTGGQANLVGINNLYAGASGLCGASPNVYFAYNTTTSTGGVVATSPAISMDGSKIAFVEDTGISAIFHVLHIRAGDGTSASSSVAPGVVANAPDAGQMTSLTLTGATGDTNSSVFVDYNADVAYVGSDNGKLYRIANVFCTQNPLCSDANPANRPQPTLDTAWTTNPVSLGSGKLTAPVVDFSTFAGSTGAVYVGSSDGKIYTVRRSTGAQIVGSPNTFGTGSGSGGIVDAPLVDSINNFIYIVTGCGNNGGPKTAAFLYQSTLTFTSTKKVNIGENNSNACPTFNIHSPTPDDTYFATVTNGHILVCGGTQGAATVRPELYAFPTNGASGQLGTNPSASNTTFDTTANAECSPLTDFLNPNLQGATERLYLGAGGPFASATDGQVFSLNATTLAAVTLPGPPPATLNPASTPAALGGTSGIIVDNITNSLSNETNSIYFSTLANGSVNGQTCGTSVKCAVKLSQNALQ